MILDNRTILPVGSAIGTHDDHPELGRTIFLRLHPVAGECGPLFLRLRGKSSSEYMATGCPDIMTVTPPNKEGVDYGSQESFDNIKGIVARNMPVIEKEQGKKFPEAAAVVIIGAGNVSGHDIELVEGVRSKVTVITVGKAQGLINGDYYVDSDYVGGHYNELKGFDCSKTIAHLTVAVYPEMAKTGMFKDRTWFGGRWGRWGRDLDIPQYHDGTTSSFSALQFAGKVLKAKSIFMLGIQQSIYVGDKGMDFVYWDAGLWMQAGCWWLFRHGVKVWNCTPNTSVVAGVVMGSLSEAMGKNSIV